MRAEARVVHEQVDRDAVAGKIRGEVRRGIRRGEIGRDHVDVQARVRGAQFGCERVEPVAAPRHEHEIVTARGELPRKLHADAGRGARDERNGAAHRAPAGTPKRASTVARTPSSYDVLRIVPSTPRSFASSSSTGVSCR